ncbi:MAG: long-chain fatty acid--CoA ligase [Candidatus Nanopelagicales bacterium]
MPTTSGSLSMPIPAYAETLSRSILDRIAATPDKAAFRSPGPNDSWSVTYTWRAAGDEMMKLGAGLLALGVELEDRVAIASSTRTEWIFADGAVMLAGGANTTIYPSTADDDFGYILSDSGARFLIAEDRKQADKAMHQRDQLPDLAKIIVIDGEGDGDFIISWEQLKELGVAKLEEDPKAIENRISQLNSESLATVIYTSGTTGRPKGVELPHRCWVFEGSSIQALDIIFPDDLQLLWLPLSHVFGKVLIAAQYQIGFETATDGRVPRIVENLGVIKPTVMVGVPRIFEKIYQGARAKAQAGGGAKAKIFSWAFDTSAKIKAAQRAGKSAGPLAGVQMALAEKLVFSKIKALTGGSIRVLVSGSAALNGDVARWFDAAGLPILEGYGLTENTAAAALTRPDDIAFGVIGQPFPGTEIKIAEDGEVLLRGPHVMRGYRNLPEVNAETLLADGWLATGDIGVLDDHGRLKITDRKKDLVKTSGGKYIAPGLIAAQFKALSSLASNLVVHANNRNYATALVSLDPDALQALAAERGLTGDFAALSQSPDVRASIQASIDQLNAMLNRWETIKRFTILDRDLAEDHGELTASLKVKRKVVEEHFADEIEQMYTS